MAVFNKAPRLRHIGHLDIQRAMQRALRRSGLPVAYSKGFNPHILVSFASALSTGAAGLREIMEVTLEREVTEETFLTAMNRALPPEMQLLEVHTVPDRHPAYMAMVCAASYDIEIMENSVATQVAEKLTAFLQQETILTERKTKSGIKECDIKPLLLEISMEGRVLHAKMVLTERESCKPNMLVNALAAYCGMEPFRTMVVRKQLFGQDEAGQIVPLETL